MRTRVTIPAMLDCEDRQYPIIVTDLAIAELAAEIAEDLPVGARCRIKLPSIMPMQSLVAWTEPGLVGCSFERLFSPETFDSLLAQWREIDGS